MTVVGDNYYLANVPTLHVEDIWFKVLPHLLRGKEHWEHLYDVEDIHRDLILGRQQLWVMVEKTEKRVLYAMLTQLDDFPKCRVLRILYLGGEDLHPRMIKEMARLERWALEHGATMVDFLGRKGWQKLVSNLGYEPVGIVMRKELKELSK